MVKKNDMENKSSNFDLTILPVRQDNYGVNIRRPYHPLLPKIDKGANVLMVSSSGSGKSSILCNIFLI